MQKSKDKVLKKIIGELLKSNIYRPSVKAWEAVDMDTFLHWKQQTLRYFVLFFKTIVSYSELLCYFFMILATLMKAGWLYMLYPVFIFGYYMVED